MQRAVFIQQILHVALVVSDRDQPLQNILYLALTC